LGFKEKLKLNQNLCNYRFRSENKNGYNAKVCGGVLRERAVIYFKKISKLLGTAVAQWLRCCATNRKVAGSILAGVIGIFH